MRVKKSLGDKFDMLTIIAEERQHIKGKAKLYYKCLCDCGNETLVRSDRLGGNKGIKSCGCLLKQYYNNKTRKHGETKTRLYSIYQGMKNRCYLESATHFHRYGGRGIRVCESWLEDFTVFRDWALGNGYRDDLTLDRVDTDGNYEPDNCRWSTKKEQSRNTSSTVKVEYKGETKSIVEWCEQFNLPYNRTRDLIAEGIKSLEDIFTRDTNGRGFTGTRYDR
ncbi:hypothetical protein MG295_00102 [Bacillus phage vB_BcgM]|nr:hypothetical protein MG295_00102 [Bacillus phage vB_BcgM]